MDRRGRLAVGIPSMLVLGLAAAALTLTGEIVGLTAVATRAAVPIGRPAEPR